MNQPAQRIDAPPSACLPEFAAESGPGPDVPRDDLSDIGYEAADPLLQASWWHGAAPDRHGGRSAR